MDLIEFLTSKEIIVVYIVALAACLLCFIIYLVERNNQKARQRHNTRELNKLVNEVKEQTEEKVEKEVVYQEPVLQVIEPIKETQEVIEPVVQEEIIEEPVKLTIEEPQIVEERKEEVEELEYTSIEPDPQTARIELQKLTEELKKQEELEATGNIPLTNYEEQQEENAIISLEELVKKSKDMYEANELTQYADEGNEPISIKELGEVLKE